MVDHHPRQMSSYRAHALPDELRPGDRQAIPPQRLIPIGRSTSGSSTSGGSSSYQTSLYRTCLYRTHPSNAFP
jgi:hypothetical protein